MIWEQMASACMHGKQRGRKQIIHITTGNHALPSAWCTGDQPARIDKPACLEVLCILPHSCRVQVAAGGDTRRVGTMAAAATAEAAAAATARPSAPAAHATQAA